MYRCPDCSTELMDAVVECPKCHLDLRPLARLSETASYYYNEGLRQAEAGNLDSAIEQLAVAVALDQQDGEARILLGDLYARQGRGKQALEHWKAAAEIDTADAVHERISSIESLPEPLLQRPTVTIFASPWRWPAAAVTTGLLGLLVGVVLPRSEPSPAIERPAVAGAVIEALRRNPDTASLSITVPKEGLGVRLSGDAPNDEVKRLIEATVRRVPGVVVADLSAVRVPAPPVEPSSPTEPSAIDLTTLVHHALNSAEGLHQEGLQITQVGRNTVKVEGRVSSLEEKALVDKIVRTVSGVEAVDVGGLEVQGRYIVRKGDSLWSIATRRYHDPTQWRRIAAANGLSESENLSPGTELIIPY